MQFAASSRTTRAPGGISLITVFAIVVIAACAQSMSAAWPFSTYISAGQVVWWLQLPALVTFVWLLSTTQTGSQAFRTAWLFATLWLATTFSWLYVAMHTYGDLNALLAAIAVLLLAATLGLYYAGAGWIWWKFHGRKGPSTLLFAAAWTLAEMARGMWFTGFGWGAIGYSHIEGPLRQFIPWVGAYGVTFVAAWIAAAIGTMDKRRHRNLVVVAILLGLPSLVPQSWNAWTTRHQTTAVTLLQGNIPQEEKFETGSGVPLALKWYGDQLLVAKGTLVVAPETAIPLLPRQLPEGYWDAIQTRYATGRSAAMVGIPLGSFEEGYSNSVVGFAPGQSGVWRYDKHHLVPFGEFIPPLFRWFTNLMNIPLGDFNRGAIGQPSFEFDGQRFAANVCYEDLFGEELGARFVDPNKAPTVFVNVSNIGWFGDSVAIDQHLNISKMRALEFQRSFVRATNTGATVIMNHRAEVLESLPRLTRGVLEGSVEGRNGITPYAWWVSRFGTWPLWILCSAIIAIAIRRSGRTEQ